MNMFEKSMPSKKETIPAASQEQAEEFIPAPELARQVVSEVLESNPDNPSVQKLLEYEKKAENLPPQVRRIDVRQGLSDQLTMAIQSRRKMRAQDPEAFRKGLEKAVMAQIESRIERGII